MAKSILSQAFVKRVTKAGRYGDGHGGCGLSLLVKPMKSSSRISKSWSQRIRINGRVAQIGLGSYPVVTLGQARDMALKNARLISQGIDPRIEKSIPSFALASEKTLAMQNHRSAKTVKAWRSLMERYCRPILNTKIDRITAADLLNIMTPIWTEKRATGQLLKVRLNQIFTWAIANGYRSDNPAESLSILPKNGNGHSHHKSVSYQDVPQAIRKIRAAESGRYAKLALEFLILTAARSGEVRGATWSEIDFDKALWTIPAERMKAGKAHRVPLSSRCLEILQEAKSLPPDTTGLVFPSPRRGVIPDNALSNLCKNLALGGTPHGFRSSFRIWAAEATEYPRELAEIALSHAVGSAIEAAYMRSDLIEQRRDMMDQWAEFVVA